MDLEAPTNSGEGDDTANATVTDSSGVDNESQQAGDTPEPDDDGNPIDPPEESEEIEHDGKKYSVPKALKPLLLMQQDYTRKTQEVATERAAVKAEREAYHQTSQAEFQAAARADAAQQRVAEWDAYAAQFGGWAAWARQDPFAAQEADLERKEIERAAAGHLSQLSNLRGQRLSAAEREAATRIEEGKAALSREVPGWSDDLKAKLITFANGYGFSRDELSDLEADPRVAKVLHAAFEGAETSRKAKAAQGHVAAQAATPAARVRTASAPPQGLDDRLGGDEWLRRRNAQVRARAR